MFIIYNGYKTMDLIRFQHAECNTSATVMVTDVYGGGAAWTVITSKCHLYMSSDEDAINDIVKLCRHGLVTIHNSCVNGKVKQYVNDLISRCGVKGLIVDVDHVKISPYNRENLHKKKTYISVGIHELVIDTVPLIIGRGDGLYSSENIALRRVLISDLVHVSHVNTVEQNGSVIRLINPDDDLIREQMMSIIGTEDNMLVVGRGQRASDLIHQAIAVDDIPDHDLITYTVNPTLAHLH